MRKAFTLIEVIVAAGIIAIVALGLLQVHGTNTKLIANISTKYQTQEEFSLVLLNADEQWHHTTKSLYDFISKDIKTKDDDIKTLLKKKKFDYSYKEFSKVEILSKDLEEFASSLEGADLDKLPELKLTINKVAITSQEGNAYGYTVSLE